MTHFDLTYMTTSFQKVVKIDLYGAHFLKDTLEGNAFLFGLHFLKDSLAGKDLTYMVFTFKNCTIPCLIWCALTFQMDLLK